MNHWYFASQVVACYVVSNFATTYKPTTKSQRVNPPLKDTRCGNSSSYLFGMVYEFMMFFFTTFPNLHRKKKRLFLGVSLTALPPNTCIFALSLLTIPDVTFSSAARRTALRMLQHLAEARNDSEKVREILGES